MTDTQETTPVAEVPAPVTETPETPATTIVSATTEFQVTDVPAVLPPNSGETLTVVAPEEPAPAEAVGPVEELPPAPVQHYSVINNYNGAAVQTTPEYKGKRIAGQPVIEIEGREYSADSLTIEWKE
jgi:hypothetical protein